MVSDTVVITVVLAICATFVSCMGIVAAVLGTRISDVRQDVRDLQRDLRDFKSEVSAALARINGHGG